MRCGAVYVSCLMRRQPAEAKSLWLSPSRIRSLSCCGSKSESYLFQDHWRSLALRRSLQRPNGGIAANFAECPCCCSAYFGLRVVFQPFTKRVDRLGIADVSQADTGVPLNNLLFRSEARRV